MLQKGLIIWNRFAEQVSAGLGGLTVTTLRKGGSLMDKLANAWNALIDKFYGAVLMVVVPTAAILSVR